MGHTITKKHKELQRFCDVALQDLFWALQGGSKSLKKHKELIGLLRFGPSKGILRHDVIKKPKEL